jgi:hypothetical protein
VSNLATLVKQGPSLGMSKKTEHFVIKTFLVLMVLAVVLLLVWTMPR